MTTENTKKSHKTGTIITYVIAVLCLLAGLFAPLYGPLPGSAGYKIENAMMFMYLLPLFNLIAGTNISVKGWPTDIALEEYNKSVLGLNIQVLAILIMAYVVVTVLAIIFLIPVCAGKKTKGTSAGCAYVIEVIAVLIFAAYFVIAITVHNGDAVLKHMNLVVAVGGTLLMLFIQCIMNKRSLGVAKVVLAVLSIAATLCLFNVKYILSQLIPVESIWDAATNDMLPAIGASTGIALVNGKVVMGQTGIGLLMSLDRLKDTFGGNGDVWVKVFYGALIAIAVLIIFNLVCDIIELACGKKYTKNGYVNANKGSKIFSLVRYSLLLVCLILAIIALLVAPESKVGINLYIVTVIVLIQLIITIVRVCKIRGQRERAKAAEGIALNDSTMSSDNTEETALVSDGSAPEEYATYDETPEVTEAPAASEPAPTTENVTVVYTVKSIYNGPSDAFMDTLTTEEKIEFAKTFIEKSKGQLPSGIPDYNVGEDNEDFFPAIFINLNKSREILSKNLLNKMYKYLNNK